MDFWVFNGTSLSSQVYMCGLHAVNHLYQVTTSTTSVVTLDEGTNNVKRHTQLSTACDKARLRTKLGDTTVFNKIENGPRYSTCVVVSIVVSSTRHTGHRAARQQIHS